MRAIRRHEPLVAVVTPVYNGASHLRRCIESVLHQSYENWIHLVVDNASQDRTRAIADEIAGRDDRILVLSHTRFVGMNENFNRALASIPDQAVFVKQLHADDALFPECLSRMVEVAEAHPQAAMVTSQRYAAGELKPDGAPQTLEVVPGREVIRAALLDGINYLGTPSAPLLRRERMVGWPRLFDVRPFPLRHPAEPPFCRADREAYLPTLEKSDLVFVPRGLIDMRRDGESATSAAQRVAGWHPSRIELLLRHGARLLSRRDYEGAVRMASLRYARSLGWRLARGALRDPEFVRFQALVLQHLTARLREARHRAEARLLAPFDAVLRRASDAA